MVPTHSCTLLGLFLSFTDIFNTNYLPQWDTAVDSSTCLERAPCLLVHFTAGQAGVLRLTCGSSQWLRMNTPPPVLFGVVAATEAECTSAKVTVYLN